ncbi:hypothetical protein FQR65_LT17980 [Abscondita terminalis]|nr:hypothetical protein FQR65_LT17980 [Abscondita terminalis]
MGLIRWLIRLHGRVAEYGHIAMILAVIGIVYASIIAIQQKDIKRLIAYSSIAHVGADQCQACCMESARIAGSDDTDDQYGISVIGLFYVLDIIAIYKCIFIRVPGFKKIYNKETDYILLAGFLLLLTCPALGQLAIKGRVVDKNTGHGVPRATIVFNSWKIRDFYDTFGLHYDPNADGFMFLRKSDLLILFGGGKNDALFGRRVAFNSKWDFKTQIPAKVFEGAPTEMLGLQPSAYTAFWSGPAPITASIRSRTDGEF